MLAEFIEEEVVKIKRNITRKNRVFKYKKAHGFSEESRNLGEKRMSILNAENITHSFGGRQILEEASFRLLKGEHIGLIGANGEGKSTFLKIITGEMQPDSGSVE